MKTTKPLQASASCWRRLSYLPHLFCLLSIVGGSVWFAAAPSAAFSKKHVERRSNPKTLRMKHRRFAHAPVPGQGEEKATSEFNEDPNEREKWFLFQRTYPFNFLPPDARRQAWEVRPKGPLEPLADQSWRSIGPSPTLSFVPNNWGVTSGRINSIAVSPAEPQVVLVGASTGGVWRSTDGGVNFVPVTDNQVDLAVGSIIFSKSNPTIAYSGMGDSLLGYLGSGVLKSTDEGQTWARVSNSTLPALGTISKVEVDSTNPDRVYVAQYSLLTSGRQFSSGFYFSNDGGITWKRTLAGLPRDLVISPANPQTLYLAMARVDESGSPPAGLYKSVDGGNTWTRIFTVPYDPNRTFDIKVSVTSADTRVTYVYTGGLIGSTFDIRVVVSTDGGATWTNRGSTGIDPGGFGYNTYIFADPSNASTVYVGSRDVYKSTDGGISWINLDKNWKLSNGSYVFTPEQSNTHTDQHALAFSPMNPNVVYIGNDGGISKSMDGGLTFGSLNATLSLTQSYCLALHPTDPTISYTGTQDNGLQLRLGDSKQWRELLTGDYGGCVIDPLDTSLVFANFTFGNIYRFNNGSTFDKQVARNSTFEESDSNPRIAFLAPLTGNGVDATLYFGTWRLFISKDLGNSWSAPAGTQDLTKGITQRGADVLSVIGVARANPNVIYTGSAQGRAMVSTNGGNTWTDITRGLPDRFIKSITVDTTNSDLANLTVSGFGSGHIFKTTDTGATWTDISGNLPDIPTNALLIDPTNPSTLYAGTDIGVFRSTVGGTIWETFSDGLPPVIVNAFAAQSSGLIQLATYGRGAYELGSGGTKDTLPPTVTVSAPNGGESLIAGSQFNINWTSSDNVGVTRHDISLSTDGGATFPITVATGLAGNAQSFLWSVPAIETTKARIRVTAFDAANNQGFGTSTGNFSIVSMVKSDFTLVVTPGSQTIMSGASTSFMVSVQSSTDFTQAVNLSVAASPADSNITSSFSSNTVVPGGNATLTISAAVGTPTSTFTIIITGTVGQLVHTTTATLSVVSPDFALVFDPTQINVSRGQKGQFTVNINRTGGFSGNVTVTAPDTRALKIKLAPPVQSTTSSSVSFNFKIKRAAPFGVQQLVFTGQDDQGRVRTAMITLVVQ